MLRRLVLFGFLFLLCIGLLPRVVQAQELYTGMYNALVTKGVNRFQAPSGVVVPAFAPDARQVEGMTFAPDGTVYISDGHLNKVFQFDPSNGSLIRTFATGAASGPDLDSPRGLVFGPDGYLYVASFWNSRILKYDPVTRQLLGIFFQGSVFEKPMGLTYRNGTLYAANYHGGVMRFTLATGVRGTDIATEAFSADTVLFDGNGTMLVSDNFNDRVLKYSSIAGAATPLIVAAGGLDGPRGLALGPDGSLYVASFWNHKIQRYQASTGAFLGTLATGDAFFTPTALVMRSAVSVAGNVTLDGLAWNAQPQSLLFTFRPSVGNTFSRPVTVGVDGEFGLNGIPTGNYEVHITGARYLASNIHVNTTAGSAFAITATLSAGDSNADNSVDVLDLAALIAAFDSAPGDSNWNPNADFNADGSVDVLDLDLLIQNFDKEGDA